MSLLAFAYADMRGCDDHGVWAEPQSLPAAHRRPDAERLRLVACGEHDSGTDDDRPAAQPPVVPLLDRGEERVGVGVEDGRRRPHEHMFA